MNQNAIFRTATLILFLILPAACSKGPERPVVDESYWQAALGAARWLDASAVQTADGTAWPPDPSLPETLDASLYSGTPGIVLFYLEAAAAADSRGLKKDVSTFLEKAKGGASTLPAKIPESKDPGLYSGLAGIGYVLCETYKATGEEKFRRGFVDATARVRDMAREAGRGIEWSSITDVISGTAGTGLFLLYAAKELKDPAWSALAARAGDRLLELAVPKNGGLDWAMDPSYPRLMPNFAHGTAGVSYFLSRLYETTRKKEYLDAALAGARYLISIADTDDGGCLIHHHEPDGTDLYYLGWCHGPVGTANLFHHLAKVSGDPGWLDWVQKEARSLMASGIPENETPGFWNNAGICCGLAGVADFFLRLSPLAESVDYLEFGRRVMRALRAKAVEEAGGLKWIQAEHRTRPDFLIAQTGLMQGAAGIGLVFLRWDARENGRPFRVLLPDAAF